jgi:hypothetical protein
MTPEAPGNLIVVDSRFEDRELRGYSERVEYSPEQTAEIERTGRGWFYVLWNETPTEEDYVPVGGGVAYVNKKELPLGYKIYPRSPVEVDSLGGDRYAYRYPALGAGLMFVLILPEGYTLDESESRPTPRSVKIFKKQRLAAYWKPEGGYGTNIKITWQIKKFDGELKFERDRINAHIDKSENVPDNAGVIVRDPTHWREERPSQARDLIFVSYSHADEELCEEFLKMVRPTAQKYGLKIWSDQKIPVGAIWREEIEKALACTRIAVLLVSPDFLDSNFIQKNELPPLLEAARAQGAHIFWIACRPCNVGDTEIGRFQGANRPSKPLSTLSKVLRETEMQRISQELFRLSHVVDEG